MSNKLNRREVALAALLQVAAGDDRQAFYKARAGFEARHGGITKSRDGAIFIEFERHQLKHALTYERVRVRLDDEIRKALEDFSDRRRAASRHDPPPAPPA